MTQNFGCDSALFVYHNLPMWFLAPMEGNSPWFHLNLTKVTLFHRSTFFQYSRNSLRISKNYSIPTCFTFYCLIKIPGLILTPPLVQKTLLIILIFFHVFFGTKSDNIHFLKRIRDYNSRCQSQADRHILFFFDRFWNATRLGNWVKFLSIVIRLEFQFVVERYINAAWIWHIEMTHWLASGISNISIVHLFIFEIQKL